MEPGACPAVVAALTTSTADPGVAATAPAPTPASAPAPAPAPAGGAGDTASVLETLRALSLQGHLKFGAYADTNEFQPDWRLDAVLWGFKEAELDDPKEAALYTEDKVRTLRGMVREGVRGVLYHLAACGAPGVDPKLPDLMAAFVAAAVALCDAAASNSVRA